ncbi:MAG: acetyl-CoA hydrolase/transferase C-terminal domain-containing protein, partial [Clostridia bacterium]
MKYDYKDKLITTEQALKLVKSGDDIVTGLGPAAAHSFLSKLHTIADRVTNVKVNSTLVLEQFEYINNAAYKNSFSQEGFFLTPPLRAAVANGNCYYVPTHLHNCAERRLSYRQPDIYVGSASMPNDKGMISLSLSNCHEMPMFKASKLKILEINPNFPFLQGDHIISIDDVDFVTEENYFPPLFPDLPSNDKDKIIGQLIANEIHDGDTIQLGIGGIPNAVAEALYGKKDLGVHTELFTSGMMKLYKAGVINNTKKTLHKGKNVTVFVMGTKELYEFVTENPDVIEIHDSAYTNNPYVIAQNDNMVSINTTIEVDLTGQCCSESIGSRVFSGTGGQSDTATGAQMAKNGRSFIALYSTAMVKNSVGERVEISKIVSQLKPGAGVSLMRNDVDYIVTEYGKARLKGASIKDRVQMLIAIAHPKFREQLYNEAKE